MCNKKHKVLAIPFAGGNKYSFSKIENNISDNIEWITLELPGRGSRFGESLLDTISEMVDDLHNQIKTHISEGDYIIYGHSMGTLLGYELTKRIIQDQLKQPVCLFFTGRGAPEYDRFSNKKSILPQDSFWDEIIKIGGMPGDILDHKELLDLYYPIFKNDFKAIENYKYAKTEKPFSMPIHILMGEEEIGKEQEEKTPLNSMKSWSNETKSTCTFEIIKGDHFFILKEMKIVAQRIMSAFQEEYSLVGEPSKI